MNSGLSKAVAIIGSNLLVLTLCAPAATSSLYGFRTIAGAGYGSSDGTNAAAQFFYPSSIVVDRDGRIYIADEWNRTIRKLVRFDTNWVSSTIAGLPRTRGSADGTNDSIRFEAPAGITLGTDGVLYVADDSTIRKLVPVGTNWVSTTIIGMPGVSGWSDGTNHQARLWGARAIALGTNGTLFVAESSNNTIRRLLPVGTNWACTTVAGLPGLPFGSADGTNTNSRFNQPSDLTVDSSGNIYVADTGNSIVRKLVELGNDWVTSTVAGIAGVSGSGDGTNTAIRFSRIHGITAADDGLIYVADSENYVVRRLTILGTNCVSSTIAGTAGLTESTDGTNRSVRFSRLLKLAPDTMGNLFVTDNCTIRKLTLTETNWVSSTIAGVPAGPGNRDGTNSATQFRFPAGCAVGPHGAVYVVDWGNSTIRELSPIGTNWISRTIAGTGAYGTADGTNTLAAFRLPTHVTVDAQGTLYVADTANNAIRRIRQFGADWVCDTIAGVASPYSQGTADGTNGAIRFYGPQGIALDDAGNLYVADASNRVIRKIIHSGSNWISSTIPGVLFSRPVGLAVDSLGKLYVADSDSHTITMLQPRGTNWVKLTIAGLGFIPGDQDGTNGGALFNGPRGVALDKAGNLYVTDQGNATIRKIEPQGTNWVCTTIGGKAGVQGFLDGLSAAARFYGPSGIAIDASGRIYLTETPNCTVRQGSAILPPVITKIAPADGLLTLSWTAGVGSLYQAQFATNLLLSSWESLGQPLTADSELMSITDSMTGAPSRFYRILLLP